MRRSHFRNRPFGRRLFCAVAGSGKAAENASILKERDTVGAGYYNRDISEEDEAFEEGEIGGVSIL